MLKLLSLIGLLVSLTIPALAQEPEDLGIGITFWEAEFIDPSKPSTEQVWQKVSIPDGWTGKSRKPPLQKLIYRIILPDDIKAEYRSGLYIDRALMNLEVYFNEDYLGNGGKLKRPMDRNWNTANLFRIPSSSWQKTNNIVYVHLYGDGEYGTFAPIIIGDYGLMRDKWLQPKHFIRTELSRASITMMSLISLFTWLLWFRTKQTLLAIMGTASLLWLTILSYGYFKQFPLAHDSYVRLTHWCIDACTLFILLFARKKYGHSIERLTKFVISYLAALALLLICLEEGVVVLVANAMHLISHAVVCYLVWVTARAFIKTRSSSDLSFCIGLVLIVSLMIHDTSLSLSKNWYRWMYDTHMGHLSIPVMFILLCYSLSSMFKNYMHRSLALNKALDQRLTASKQQLTAQLETGEALIQQQRIVEEREQIYNDVHDDLGAKLLSLVYASPEPDKNDLARSTLQDLRDVVSRTKSGIVSVESLVMDCIHEQQQRCEKLNVIFNSTTNQLATDVNYDANKALMLRRLIRELVGVCIHSLRAHGIELTVMIGVSGIEVAAMIDTKLDDFDKTSLQARAQRLGSELQVIHDEDKKPQIVCWIPHQI